MDYSDIAVHHYPKKVGPENTGQWACWFLVLQFACQLALLVSFIGPFRIVVRMTSFASSLVLLGLIRRRSLAHPSQPFILCALAILGLEILHPTTNTLVAGLAEIALNCAIAAPLFWATRLTIDLKQIQKIILVLWMFHCSSSIFGILQTYFPGKFQPNLSQSQKNLTDDALQSLMITTADGSQIYRPMGLTDTPGGAASAGFYAVLLGVGFFLFSERLWFKATCLGGMVIGLMCILLSQVRSVLVMLCCCLLALSFLLVRRGEGAKFAKMFVALAAIAVIGFSTAVAVGGASVTNRLATLVADNPSTVYQQNRGHFFQDTVQNLLPEFPLGAGLGRWGMVNSYFGDNSNPDRTAIWAEIQWTGWVLDGGLPLVLAYTIAILVAIREAFRIVVARNNGPLWIWAAVIVAYDFGALAVTFNYPLFIGQGGMEFWLLNAALYVAHAHAVPSRIPLETHELISTGGRGLRSDWWDGHGELRLGPVAR